MIPSLPDSLLARSYSKIINPITTYEFGWPVRFHLQMAKGRHTALKEYKVLKSAMCVSHLKNSLYI